MVVVGVESRASWAFLVDDDDRGFDSDSTGVDDCDNGDDCDDSDGGFDGNI